MYIHNMYVCACAWIHKYIHERTSHKPTHPCTHAHAHTLLTRIVQPTEVLCKILSLYFTKMEANENDITHIAKWPRTLTGAPMTHHIHELHLQAGTCVCLWMPDVCVVVCAGIYEWDISNIHRHVQRLAISTNFTWKQVCVCECQMYSCLCAQVYMNETYHVSMIISHDSSYSRTSLASRYVCVDVSAVFLCACARRHIWMRRLTYEWSCPMTHYIHQLYLQADTCVCMWTLDVFVLLRAGTYFIRKRCVYACMAHYIHELAMTHHVHELAMTDHIYELHLHHITNFTCSHIHELHVQWPVIYTNSLSSARYICTGLITFTNLPWFIIYTNFGVL